MTQTGATPIPDLKPGLFDHLCAAVDQTDANDLELVAAFSAMLGQTLARLPGAVQQGALKECVAWIISNSGIGRPS